MIEVWNKIDIEEEGMGVDEDEEADEASSFSGEDDETSMITAENEGTEEPEYVCERSLGDLEAVEEKEDYSDGWLYEDTLVNEDDFCSPSSAADPQNESSKDNVVEKYSSMGPPAPHVKTSAVMGVGLQELLELIDEKLSAQDKKLKGAQVVERNNIFHKKWRPSHTENSSIAVEQ